MDTRQTVNERSAKIADINDEFRRNMDEYIVTSKVLDLYENKDKILARIRGFSEFNEDDGFHGEHDLGFFIVRGVWLFWRIDYYDAELKSWCDPLSPDCRRILTIMLAEEYWPAGSLR